MAGWVLTLRGESCYWGPPQWASVVSGTVGRPSQRAGLWTSLFSCVCVCVCRPNCQSLAGFLLFFFFCFLCDCNARGATLDAHRPDERRLWVLLKCYCCGDCEHINNSFVIPIDRSAACKCWVLLLHDQHCDSWIKRLWVTLLEKARSLSSSSASVWGKQFGPSVVCTSARLRDNILLDLLNVERPFFVLFLLK